MYFLSVICILLIINGLNMLSVKGDKGSKFVLPDRLISAKGKAEMKYFDDAKKNNPLDLYLGQPDYLPPKFVTNNLLNVTLSDDVSAHQYAPSPGDRRLRKNIATFYSQLINRHLNPDENVIVTAGATDALYTTIQTHTLPGDEWILFEPFYGPHPIFIQQAEGVPVYMQLKPPKTHNGTISAADWTFDKKELSRLFNKKTKGIILNNPHNPTGKVFTREELQFIGDLVIKWNIIVVADEVYEWLIFDSNKHIRIASLPDMFERTITISSSSKTYLVTGWRIGWAYGPSDIVENLKQLHIHSIYSVSVPTQLAMASVLNIVMKEFGHSNSYLKNHAKELELKRDYIVAVLQEIGMKVTVPQAGYFITADWTTLNYKMNLNSNLDVLADYQFTNWLSKNVGVLFMPQSTLYWSKDKSKNVGAKYIRVCIAKKNKTLQKAADLLLTHLSKRR